MATDDDAIPGLIEEDLDVAFDLIGAAGESGGAAEAEEIPDPTTTAAAKLAAPEDRASRARLTAHTRPTGQFSTEELARHTDVTTPGRRLKDTLEMDVEAIDALIILSNKDAEEIEDLENTFRESRRPRSRQH